MDRYKIHKAVEYIRIQPGFPFDGADVEESVEEVLAYFGLHPQLDEEEKQVLREELLPMAWADEEAEMSRVVELSGQSGVTPVSDKFHVERCAPEGVHFSLCPPVLAICHADMRQGVSPTGGENAPRGE